MGIKKFIVPAIGTYFAIALAIATVLYVGEKAWLDMSRQYENIISLHYSEGGGFGLPEEMTSSQLTIHFVEKTIKYETTSFADGRVLTSWEKRLEQEQLEGLRKLLVIVDFLSLPESYGSDMSLDAPQVSITLKTNETEHRTSGFMPGNKRFRTNQSQIQAIYDAV